jgi:hypothetical protein
LKDAAVVSGILFLTLNHITACDFASQIASGTLENKLEKVERSLACLTSMLWCYTGIDPNDTGGPDTSTPIAHQCASHMVEPIAPEAPSGTASCARGSMNRPFRRSVGKAADTPKPIPDLDPPRRKPKPAT